MTAQARRAAGGLGRGLAALIPQRPADAVTQIPVAHIQRNPFQPRQRVEREELERLAASIAAHGVLQPVLVTETLDGYRLIAGERRVRAAELAGLATVPAIVRHADEREQLAFALVENVQRADLNAMEEARAYRQLIDEFDLSQEEVARAVGRARPTISNALRLLELSPAVQAAVSDGSISEGHARAVATLPDHPAQERLLAIVRSRSLSVRQTEDLARRLRDGAAREAVPEPRADDSELGELAAALRTALSTKVTITPSRRGGRITIEYYDSDDLGRLCDLLARGSA